jgi:hypothetical protein
MKYASRKFLLAALFGVTACVAFLFYDNKLTGGEFAGLALGILTTFTAGDAYLNKIHKANSEAPQEPQV